MRYFVPVAVLALVASQASLLSFVSAQNTTDVDIGTPPPVPLTTPKPLYRQRLNALGYFRDTEEDAKLRYCKEQCTDSCVECAHPRLCDTEARRIKKGEPKENATQVFCGMEEKVQLLNNVYCPAHEKCIPKGWRCKLIIRNLISKTFQE